MRIEGRKGTLREGVTDLLMSGALKASRLKIVDFPILKEMAPSISPLVFLAVAIVLQTLTTVRLLGDSFSINFTFWEAIIFLPPLSKSSSLYSFISSFHYLNSLTNITLDSSFPFWTCLETCAYPKDLQIHK